MLSISIPSTQAMEKSNIVLSAPDYTDRDDFNVNTSQQSDPITLVISEVVNSDRIQEYENWQKGIHQAIKGFDGFLGVDVIRPSDHIHPEYVTIVKFDTYNNLKKWQESPVCLEWIVKSQDFIVSEAHLQKASGLELWFTMPPKDHQQMPQPAYYKMVIVSTVVVYPLILIINGLLGPVLKRLPFSLMLLISVVIVSGLMTYPLMPWVTRALGFWLYP